jgi:hypothetical protein
MRHVPRAYGVLAALLLATACGENPTAPPSDVPDPTPIDPSIITPFILPSGADWGLYFQSFNQTKTLTARVIHYPSGVVNGNGYFAVPLFGTGVLRVTSARPYGNCIPQASPCGTVTNVPESAVARGMATFLSGAHAGQVVPFRLDLHSNLWPNPTNTFDTATLKLCFTSTQCVSQSFYGELHHEPQ